MPPGAMAYESPDVFLDVLLRADRELAVIPVSDPYQLYERLHQLAAELAPVEAFYVCLYSEPDETLFFVYNYDGDVYDEPATVPLGKGPTSWVVRHRQPFILEEKTEERQRAGIRFGDHEKRSRSAVHVPLMAYDSTGEQVLLGVLSAQSYTEGVYGRRFVGALQWLADRAAALLQQRIERTAASAERAAAADSAITFRQRTLALSEAFVQVLKTLTKDIEALRPLLPKEDTGLRRAVDALCRAGYRAQTEANQFPLQQQQVRGRWQPPAPPINTSLIELTERERDIALLVAEGLTNRKIGEQLFISPDTVKFHVANILKKLEVGNRADIARIITAASGLLRPTQKGGEKTT
jgi:DNA-binding CsgD family transcriptional regulator